MERVHEWLVLGKKRQVSHPRSIRGRKNRRAYLRYPKNGNFLRAVSISDYTKTTYSTYLLLEVASVLFVNENKVEVVARAELLVHVAECRRQVKPAEE